jgi:hypothetical protein
MALVIIVDTQKVIHQNNKILDLTVFPMYISNLKTYSVFGRTIKYLEKSSEMPCFKFALTKKLNNLQKNGNFPIRNV